MNARTRALAGTAAWGVAAGVSGLAGATGGIAPGIAAFAVGIAGFGASAHLLPAFRRPEIGLFGASICRGVHPARAALTIDGARVDLLAPLAESGATATFFVGPGEADPFLAAGHEVGLLYRGFPSRTGIERAIAEFGLPVRWVRPSWLAPGLAGLPIVGASVRVRRVPDGIRVVGTDVVAIHGIDPGELGAVLREWDARAVHASTLTGAMEMARAQ